MLNDITFFFVSYFSTIIGAISGIGGGIIIKPVLDVLGTLNINVVRFFSGCTVLSMSIWALIRSIGGDIIIEWRVSLLLALGACLGGLLGKELFSILFPLFKEERVLSILQSVLLLTINAGVFVYLKNKKRITTIFVESALLRIIIGLSLGAISSFLGIGGGPINLGVLYYFFSMQPKQAALNSLYIIFFSQLTNLFGVYLAGEIPTLSSFSLFVMCGGGVAGALTGSAIYKKLTQQGVEKFFGIVMVFLMILNIYNIIKFFV